ncbi:MAG: CYTH domain-containing protein [Smithella sp.]|nr:CYTH domain-containing protein [Smithella sp.]
MPLEIERKFLVNGNDWKTSNGERYVQGYLNLDKGRTVRVRLTGKHAFLTIKGVARGISRREFEYEIPVCDAEELLKMCEGSIIEKTRHAVFYKGLTWEIDEFLGENEGLIIAEVELDSEDQIFEKPPWLGTEVTNDARYFNSNLTVIPFKQWNDKSIIANP